MGGSPTAALLCSLVGGWGLGAIWQVVSSAADVAVPLAVPSAVVTLTPQACHCHCDVNVTSAGTDTAGGSTAWRWVLAVTLLGELLALAAISIVISLARRGRALLSSAFQLGKSGDLTDEDDDPDVAAITGGKRRKRGLLTHLAVDPAAL